MAEQSASAAEFHEALGRLPFKPVGPQDWRLCARGMPSHSYGPTVGFAGLTLVHRREVKGREQVLSVSLTATAPSPASVARSQDAALQRMSTFNESARVSSQGTVTVTVEGEPHAFRMLVMDDGQWAGVAESGPTWISLAARGWPLDGLELVAVDPSEYLDGMLATGG
jgi:hypothetical protein